MYAPGPQRTHAQRGMSAQDPLLKLLARFRDEGVEYVLVDGQAVRLNGYVRATEDIDVLIKATSIGQLLREHRHLESFAHLPQPGIERGKRKAAALCEINVGGVVRSQAMPPGNPKHAG